MLVSEAPTSTMNGLEGSGCLNMGTVVKASLTHENAWSAARFHCSHLAHFFVEGSLGRC